MVNKIFIYPLIFLFCIIFVSSAVHAGTLSLQTWKYPDSITDASGVVGTGYAPGNYTIIIPNIWGFYLLSPDSYKYDYTVQGDMTIGTIEVNDTGEFRVKLVGSQPQIYDSYYSIQFGNDHINALSYLGKLDDCDMLSHKSEWAPAYPSGLAPTYDYLTCDVQSVPEFTPIAIIVAITGTMIGIFRMKKTK